MRQLATTALIAMAIVLAITGPSAAQGMAASGHHDGGGHHHAAGHDDSGGDHYSYHDGQHQHRHPHIWGGPFVYWNYPAYVAPTAGYWYYFPSAEAYYPYVTYCLDSWVPIPAR